MGGARGGAQPEEGLTGEVALLERHAVPADAAEGKAEDVEAGVLELSQQHLAAERVVAVHVEVEVVPLLVPSARPAKGQKGESAFGTRAQAGAGSDARVEMLVDVPEVE